MKIDGSGLRQVSQTPDDVDSPRWDISSWITKINGLKMEHPVLSEEGSWRTLNNYGSPYLFLEKTSAEGASPLYVCVNREQTNETVVEEGMIPEEVKKCKSVLSLLAESPEKEALPPAFTLDPADVILFIP